MCRGDTGCDRLKGNAVGAAGGDSSDTGDGERHSNDLAPARALAERDGGERNGEYRLQRRDHRREPRGQSRVHRHEQQAELSDADEQADGDNGEPAHIWKGISPKRSTAKRSGGNDSRPMS